VSYSVDEISWWRLYFICTYQGFETSQKFKEKKKLKQSIFFLQFLPWHPFGRRLDVDFLFWVALIVYEFFLITFLMWLWFSALLPPPFLVVVEHSSSWWKSWTSFFSSSLFLSRVIFCFIPARFLVVRQDFDSQPGFFFPFCVSFFSFLVPGCMFQFFRFCLSSDIIGI